MSHYLTNAGGNPDALIKTIDPAEQSGMAVNLRITLETVDANNKPTSSTKTIKFDSVRLLAVCKLGPVAVAGFLAFRAATLLLLLQLAAAAACVSARFCWLFMQIAVLVVVVVL